MNDEELDAIEARENAATEGPWHWVAQGIGQEWGHGGDNLETVKGTEHPCSYFCGSKHREGRRHIAPDTTIITSTGYDADSVIVESSADAAFIAAARSDVPKLIAEIRRLHAASTTADQGAADG